MLNEVTEDAFAACLEALENGADLEAVLANYPELAADLRPLLQYARLMHSAGQAAPSPNTNALRASRLQMLKRYEAATYRQHKWGVLVSGWRATAMSGIALLALVLGSFGIVQAAAPSLPGDTLYPVKRTAEQLRLWLSFDITHKQTLENEFEAERLEEIRALNAQGRVAPIEFSGRIEALADEGWQIAGVTVKLNATTRLEGVPRLHASAEVHGLLQADGTVVAEEIHIEEADAIDETPELEDTAEPTAPAPPAEPTGNPPPTANAVPQPSSTATQTALSLTQAPTSLPPTATLAQPTLAASYTPTNFATELEFTGLVQAITGNVWRIADREVVVTANTELNGNPQLGQQVEVHAVWESGQWVAHQIERKDEAPASSTPQPTSATLQPSHTQEPRETPEPTESPEPTEPPEPSETPKP